MILDVTYDGTELRVDGEFIPRGDFGGDSPAEFQIKRVATIHGFPVLHLMTPDDVDGLSRECLDLLADPTP